MELGCHLPMSGPTATRDNLIRFARRMEALGYDSLWVRDHVVLPWTSRRRYPYSQISPSGRYPVAPDVTLLEALTTLAVVAGVTDRVKLGTTVLVLPHRHPVLAAKMLATLDHLSNGRVILGAGVGWLEEEIELFGVPYARRGAWSDEAIRVMRACWSEARVSHHGEFFDIEGIACFPQPEGRRIPIWIGGDTPRALRRVAELGDGWHPAFASPEEIEAGLEVLRAECTRIGRRPEEVAVTLRAVITITTTSLAPRPPLQGTPEEIVADLERYAALGVRAVVLQTRSDDADEMSESYADVAREIRPRLRVTTRERPSR